MPTEKLVRILSGEAVIMGDGPELDALEWEIYDCGVEAMSIPNPKRLGLRDAYLVGLKTQADIRAWRKAHSID